MSAQQLEGFGDLLSLLSRGTEKKDTVNHRCFGKPGETVMRWLVCVKRAVWGSPLFQ